MVKKDDIIGLTDYTLWVYRNIIVGNDAENNQNIVKVNKNGSLDVEIQDQFTETVDFYLCKNNGTTNPTVAIDMGDMTVTVASTTGAVVGDCINISDDLNFFQSLIKSIDGNVITMLSPSNRGFDILSSVCFGEWDFSTANGSVTPVAFEICPPKKAKYDIVEMTVSIEDNTVMYESTFGGITALANGIIGRIKDGNNKQLFLITNNTGFREYGFSTNYPEKVPSGTYAFFADKLYTVTNGVTLRIVGENNDKIEVLVQDNLTGLSKMSITVHGHVVKD